jgi:hypothetical protein
MNRNHANEIKLIWALVIALLIGAVAHAQDYSVSFSHPTNSAPIKSYVLYAQTNGIWVGQAWCNGTTNEIAFKSWNLPSNPCQLAIKSFGFDDSISSNSISIKFDTADFVVKTNVITLPNPVLPPTFLFIRKL